MFLLHFVNAGLSFLKYNILIILFGLDFLNRVFTQEQKVLGTLKFRFLKQYYIRKRNVQHETFIIVMNLYLSIDLF